MKYQGKEINDECSRCGNIFECVLFLKGHGIDTEREHVADMLNASLSIRKGVISNADN